MTAKRNGKPRRSSAKKNAEKKKLDLAALYAKARREFTTADLQRFTVIEEGIPAEQVIAQLEEIDRKTKRRKK